MTVAAIDRIISKAKPHQPGVQVIPHESALDYIVASALPPQPDDDDQLVEGVLGRIALSILFGDSNSGKTFAAIDMGAAISLTLPWMGRNVVGGLVVYLATESPRSVITRLQAYQQHNRCRLDNFVVVRTPINLFDGQADAAAVVDLIKSLEDDRQMKCELVIGDTLSRMAAGSNENSGEDMGIVIQHAEHIVREASVHFMAIHHSGKDAARGARGWSGLRAAVDTELEVTADDTGNRVIEITKQRDIPGKGERIGFKLLSINLGIGQWGKPRSSCVVESADAPAKPGPGKRPSEIAGAIVQFLTQRGSGARKSEIVKQLEKNYKSGSVYRELDKMAKGGRLEECIGIVTLRHAFTVEKS